LGLRTKFQSYANSKVRWVILDELRKVDPMPQWARLRMRETERARNELAQTLGRVPTGLRWRDAWRWKSGSTALLDRFAPTQVGVS